MGLFSLLYSLLSWASYLLKAPVWSDLRLCFHTPHCSSWSLKLVTHKLNLLPGMLLHSAQSANDTTKPSDSCPPELIHDIPTDRSPQRAASLLCDSAGPWEGVWVCDFWLEESFQTVFPGLLRVLWGYLRNWSWGEDETKQESTQAPSSSLLIKQLCSVILYFHW